MSDIQNWFTLFLFILVSIIDVIENNIEGGIITLVLMNAYINNANVYEHNRRIEIKINNLT